MKLFFKNFLLLIFVVNFSFGSSDVTRTNYSANSVLTSAALNADFNQILTRINDFPGDQITAATIPRTALETGAVAKRTVRSITTTDTAVSTDDIILCSTAGGAYTLTLPTASGISGKMYQIKKTTSDNNSLTIDPTSTETIDGVSTKLLYSQYDFYTLVSDGTNWIIVEKGVRNRYQIKYLSSNVTANNSDITDLKFSGLVVGRIYKASYVVKTGTGTSVGAIANFYVQNNSVRMGSSTHTRDGTTTENADGFSFTFVAAATTLVSSFAEVTDGTLYGDGTSATTYAIIEDITDSRVASTYFN